MLLGELFAIYGQYQLCPNVKNYVMSQGWSYTNGKGLQFYVQPRSDVDFSASWEAAYLIDETTVYSSMLSRNFNPYHYNTDGYMKIMAVTYNTYTLSGFETTDVTL